MKISKAYNRDKRRRKQVNGMRVTGKSLFTIQEIQNERAYKIRKARKEQQKREADNGMEQ